jgi:subtilisin family serine protease
MLDHASTGAAQTGRRGHRTVVLIPMPILRTVTLTALALALLPASAGAAERTVVPGEVIVRFADGATPAERIAARAAADARIDRSLPVAGAQLLSLDPGTTIASAVAALERDDDVLYAEPNVIRRISATPNDPQFGLLWGLANAGAAVRSKPATADADIDGSEAYDVTRGAGAVVAVVDTGVALGHPDLAGSRWSNPREVVNGIDDDLNGYRDDTGGWDWVGDDPDPSDENGHGTHVAGTVLARADNAIGVAGVAPAATLMPLRVLDANGSGPVADVAAAYRYAAGAGARIVNLSLGGPGLSRIERDAIAAAPRTLFAVAAGNGGDDRIGDDNDAIPDYPCNHDLPNIVCVTATSPADGLPTFANYGAANVDVAAPGVDILSTTRSGATGYMTGTSMAAPHVAGAAALLFSRAPSAAVADVRQALLSTVDPVPALAGKTVTGGRLNAARALGVGLSDEPPPPPPAPPVAPAPAPAVGTAAAPAPAPAADTAPPVVRAAVARRQRLSTVRRRGVRSRLTCSEACRVEATLTVSSTTARRLGLHARRATVVVLGRATRTLTGGRSTTVTLRISGSVARRLARLSSVRTTLAIVVRDRAGNARTVRLALRFAR